MGIDREKLYESFGVVPTAGPKKPNPPPDHGWGADVSDEDLATLDPKAHEALQTYRTELRAYTVKCLEGYAKEKTAQFFDMPPAVAQRATAKISERLTQEPTIYFDATGELNQERYKELCDAALTESCNATGYAPRQTLESYIEDRQRQNPETVPAKLAALEGQKREGK